MALFLLLNLLTIAALFATIRVVPAQALLPIFLEHGPPRPPPKGTLLTTAGRRINRGVRSLLNARASNGRSAATVSKPLSVAFYAPWDESSTASLQRHISDLDWIAPVWVTVWGPHHQFTMLPDPAGRAVLNSTAHRPLILPVVQNFLNGHVDSAGVQGLLADPQLRRLFLDRFEQYLVSNSASGAVFDFEELDPAGRLHYLQLLREARLRFDRHGWILTVAVPVGGEWDSASFARVADKLFIMAYDEHSSDGEAGPIASQQWWATNVAEMLNRIPPDKAIVTLGNYAYDWHDGTADPLNVEEAWLEAADSQTTPVFDRVSGNSSFAFSDETGHLHTTWILDAASAFNQLTLLDRANVRQVAFWRLGAEDRQLYT